MTAASVWPVAGRCWILVASLAMAFAMAMLPVFPLSELPEALRVALALLIAFGPGAFFSAFPAELPSAGENMEALISPHRELGEALDGSLMLVIGDTETSAIAIMQQLRELHDSAASLVAMLVDSRTQAEQLDAEIASGLAMLAGMRERITELPDRISTNLSQVRGVADQIRELNGLAELVQSISIQSHLLAINAAIEAHRAGEQGRTFRVVADEVKNLAANSGRAASEIGERRSSTWNAVESGMQSSVDESLQQLDEIVGVADSIRALEQKHHEFSAYYRAQFSAVTEHNEALASEIVNVIGRAQYQDVVRQSVDRIRSATQRSNDTLHEALSGQDDVTRAAQALASLLAEYRGTEQRHTNSDRASAGITQTGELTIELF